MSRVFVVQRQQRWDREANRLVDKFDLAPAREHGELIYLLSPNAAPFHSIDIVNELHRKLEDYNAQDFLLLIGNPCLIGFVVAIASSKTDDGDVNLLQWSGKDRRYISVSAKLF